MRATPYTDAWKERLRARLGQRGVKADLARFLSADESEFAWRTVQIAKVLNSGVIPDTEFLLATEAFIASQGGWPKRSPARRTGK